MYITHHTFNWLQSLSHIQLFETPPTVHIRLPCPPPSPGACSNSSPSSPWCHPTISSSAFSFSSCHQSFPASGSFPMSQFFASGGQSIGASASLSVFSMNIQGWFALVWTSLISWQSKGPSRVFSNTAVQKYQFLGFQFPCGPALISILTTGKTIALTRWNFIYIYKHIWIHTYVRKSFWKGYNYILDKENK